MNEMIEFMCIRLAFDGDHFVNLDSMVLFFPVHKVKQTWAISTSEWFTGMASRSLNSGR
jgi:hypothetical protein